MINDDSLPPSSHLARLTSARSGRSARSTPGAGRRQPRKDLGKELGAEHWKADGLEFLELSIRVKFANAEKWLRKFAAWATDEGLDIASVGTTKTQAVLEHFAQRLAP